MEDITIRVLNTLKTVDVIACEDTRHSLLLLNYYDIKKPLVSLHEHNEMKRGEEIIELLQSGKNVALISDAGMPGIQDPGFFLLKMLKEKNIPYTVLPGACALVTSVVASALAEKEFLFVGFLPRKKNLQTKYLKEIEKISCPIVFYEAPHRLIETIKNIYHQFGNRKITLCREITKKFEEYIHTDLGTFLSSETNIRGEFVFIIEGYIQKQTIYTEAELIKLLREQISAGKTKKDAVAYVTEKTNLPKKKIYALSIDMK